MKRLAVITTHPIQYYAPLFRLLCERKKIIVRVFYTWEKDSSIYDKDFGKAIEWDIPLLEGYDFQFVSNGGSTRKDFRGVRNPDLISEVENWGAQAILVFGWNYYSHLKAMRYFKGRIPVLFRGDSTLLDEKQGMKKIARRLFLRWVYSHIDIALYVGTNNKKYFSVLGMKENQLIFTPHAVDNDRFYDPLGKYEREAMTWRHELGMDTNAKVLVFVGKFQEKKDPLLLIKAFNRIEDENAHLVMVGNGELEQSLKELSQTNPNIHFVPFQNQSRMPVVYRLGNVFCLPSKGPGETWGLAINEAMACGRAVLVSDRCGSAVDLVHDHRNGFIFASGNMDDLVDKIKILFQKSGIHNNMGESSREIIQSWSYDRIVPEIENVILARYA